MMQPPVLAATVHDRTGASIDGLRRCGEAVRHLFAGVCVLATEPTSSQVVKFLHDDLDATVIRAAANGEVGRHRRAAVQLARRSGLANVFYCDLDHVLRWIDVAPQEIATIISEPEADLVVVGRTPRAMSSCPARLRETESIVNHIYELATGHAWDLMFAIRLMSPTAADIVVSQGIEDSYANDVEWPLLVEEAGLTVEYREADGLSYRIAEDFDATADRHDGDPGRWIERVHIANLHAQAIGRRLAAATPADQTIGFVPARSR